MRFKKMIFILIAFALVVMVSSELAFANFAATGDKIYDGALTILQTIQKYSWPVAFLFFVFAIYKFYILGTEAFEAKMTGQKMVIGTAICLAIIQCLPLAYVFIVLR